MEKQRTVLIIDDEEDLRDTVEYKLTSRGFTAVCAVDGVDGLEKLKTVKPDLIILDMNMPRMNGLEFYQHIKGADDKPQFPILVLTARANMEQLFRDLDVDSFMAKPFDLDLLVKEVEIIIKKHAHSIQKEIGSDEVRAKRVCVVENDRNRFDRIALAFLNSGYMVNAAHSGASAMKRIMMDVPDVVVISLGLSDISGDIVIGKLHRLEVAKNVKFILYTTAFSDVDKTMIARRISEKEGVSQLIQYTDPNDLLSAIGS
jgi:two-component system, chemotaxis family, chemotaxis protein CheY